MYLVEGNVGAGKSTLLSLITKNLPHMEVVFENVNSWDRNEYGKSLLTQFYQDTPRWSYTMETYTMLTRIKEHLREQAHQNPFKIIERSLFSGHYCFAKNGYLQGCMDETEWKLYSDWFSFLVEQYCQAPDGFIYLQADPKECQARAQKRNRSSEERITLAYFEQIHEQHEVFLIKKQGISPFLKDIPVLVLDATHNFELSQELTAEYLERINDFILITQAAKRAKPTITPNLRS